jgi:hypothetical protein
MITYLCADGSITHFAALNAVVVTNDTFFMLICHCDLTPSVEKAHQDSIAETSWSSALALMVFTTVLTQKKTSQWPVWANQGSVISGDCSTVL